MQDTSTLLAFFLRREILEASVATLIWVKARKSLGNSALMDNQNNNVLVHREFSSNH